jgi:AAA domain
VPTFADVPKILKDTPHWIVWRREKRKDAETKVPYDANKPKSMAKSNDSATWATFEKAAAVADDPLNDFDGIGFMLQGTNFVGVDFDGVIDETGAVDPYVLSIIAQLGNPYTEITPSGTGMRCFVESDKLPAGKRKFSAGGDVHYGIEIYIGVEGGRYLTVTGNKYGGEGVPHIDDLEIPYFLISQFRNIKLKKLWTGDPSDYMNDGSRADLALCDELVKLLGKDPVKIERYFNVSGLCDEKWTSRPEYREWTITKALGIKSANPDSPQKSPNADTAYGVAPATPVRWEPNKKPTEERPSLVFKSEPKTEVTAFDFVLTPAEGQLDGWFPLGSPSLIGGSSGSGKSTFMLDLCVQQKISVPFFGHQTHGRPYLVLMLDRGKHSHERTMRRLGFVLDTVPIKFIPPVLDFAASQAVLDRIEECEVTPEIVFIEGMDMLVSDANKMEVVTLFLREMQQIATHFHIALIGSTGSPKTKPREGYTQKRDTIFGSQAWGRMVETVACVQYPQGDDTADQREISVLLRNGKAEKFTVEFQQGRLVLLPSEIEEDQPKSAKEMRKEAVRERAEKFIMDSLQNGPDEKNKVVEAATMRNIKKADIYDAAGCLEDRGVLVMKNISRETVNTRAKRFIVDFLKSGPQAATKVYGAGTRGPEGFSRKTMEEASADLTRDKYMMKKTSPPMNWELLVKPDKIDVSDKSVSTCMWELVPVSAKSDSVKPSKSTSSEGEIEFIGGEGEGDIVIE